MHKDTCATYKLMFEEGPGNVAVLQWHRITGLWGFLEVMEG